MPRIPAHRSINTRFANQTYSMMLAGYRLPPLLLIVAALTVSASSRAPAQHVIYHDPYPANALPGQVYSTGPYPVVSPPLVTYPTTYPVGQPVILHEGSRVIRSPAVPSAVSVSRTAPSSPSPKTRTQSQTRSDTNTNSRSNTSSASAATFDIESKQPAARLASTRRISPRSVVTDVLDSEPSPFESLSPYRIQMIRQARQEAVTMRSVASTAPTVVADLAVVTADFADQWAVLAEQIIALSDRVHAAAETLDETTRDFDDVNAKLTHYGMTQTIGLLLRDKKQQLAARQVHDAHTEFANQELERLRQLQLDLELVRYNGTDIRERTTELLAAAGYDAADERNLRLVSQVSHLFRQQQTWIESLERGYQDYRQKLGQLDSVATAAAELAGDFRKLIDRHIIWIRSEDPISVQDLRALKGGIAAMFDTGRSADFGPAIARKWGTHPGRAIGLLVCIFLISIVRWRGKSWVIGIGRRKRLRDAEADTRKLVVSFLTPLVALAFPAILFAIGRWLGSGIVSESTLYVASGCFAASLVALMVEVPRQLLRNDGFLDKHMGLELPRRGRAVAYLTVIGFGLVLAAYTITVMGSIDHGIWKSSVSRFGFMAAMLLVAWTFHLALRPSGGLLEPLIARFGGTVIHQVRLLIYLGGIGFPFAMIGLSALGYGFTAKALLTRAMITLTGLLIAATLWAGVKIASARAWHLLTASTSGRQPDRQGSGDSERVVGTLGEHSLELKHQIAFLFQCALVLGGIASIGWLWVDAIPNARMGNPVVWTVSENVTAASIDASGQAFAESLVETTPITAMHLVLAAATLFVAFQLSKLLPALFDALVLQRVSFDEAMEHFSLVLGRCLLFGVGCFVAARLVGVRWHAIQWLAVGLTIGLGFGLQDMVRNVFGGLVVLFEKPARLGDFVTVGKVTGRVAAQRLRTTVLSDDDGREVTIPNKKFVSEDVVNWMGAGRLQVIPIEVAVTRDERPADICRMLYELALEQEDVLLTPAPQATLVCVAQRSQRIELRVWVENDQNVRRYRDNLLRTAKTFLREREWLAADQPNQPQVPELGDDQVVARKRARSTRRRSA